MLVVDSHNEWISVDNISRKSFGDKDLSFLSILHSEGHIRFKEEQNILEIPFSTFYTLTKSERKSLGFPQDSHFSLSLKTNGAVLLPKFSISYIFNHNRMKISGVEVIDKIFVKFQNKTYTLPSHSAQIISLIDEHKALDGIADKERKAEVFEKIMEIIPPELQVKDDRLKTIRVSFSEKFSLELDEKNGQIHPQILCSEGGVNLLPVELDLKLKKLFERSSHVQSYYHLGNNKFVFIPQNLKKVLRQVKDVQKKPASEKLSFFYNPKSYLSKKVDAGELQESDLNLLEETEQYVSERIEKLGEWNPKSYKFDAGHKNEWLPSNTEVFCTGEEIHFIKEDDIAALQKAIEDCEKEEKSVIEYEGQEIEITDDLKNFIQNKIEYKNQPQAKEGGSEEEKKEESENASVKPLVPIIIDNIDDEDFFLEDLDPRPNVHIHTPSKMLKFPLYKHQKIGLQWLQESFKKGKRGVLLADDMGLGKTYQSLAFLTWLRGEMQEGRDKGGPILIVGPTSLLENWKKEHRQTLEGVGLGDCVDAYGSSLRALRRLGSKQSVNRLNQCSWALTTYESMRNDQSLFRRIAWKVIIFDEIQKIKNPSSFVTEMAKALAAEFTIGLTGTPVENSLVDLWCLSDAIWPGVLGPYKNFRKRYLSENTNLPELKSSLTEKNPPPFMLRRMKEDEIEGLPQKIEHLIPEFMQSKQVEMYNEILRAAENREFKKSAFEIVHRLKRVSLGFWTKDMEGNEILQNSARLRATIKILDEIYNRKEKVLIFVESKEFQTEILIPLLTERYNLDDPPRLINGETIGKTRQEYVNTFEALPSGFAVMILSPKTGGTGFTLINANNVIHLERAWNPAIEDQCSDRVYRLNQKKDVNIYLPQALHPSEHLRDTSFDMTLHKLLTRKRQLSQEVIVPTGLDEADKQEFLQSVAHVRSETIALNDDFYVSEEWRDLAARFKASKYIRCNREGCDKAYPRYEKKDFHVDHIKPRSKYPELALVWDNLQILCATCNLSKGNRPQSFKSVS